MKFQPMLGSYWKKNEGKMIPKGTILGVFTGIFGWDGLWITEHITPLQRSTLSCNAEHQIYRDCKAGVNIQIYSKLPESVDTPWS